MNKIRVSDSLIKLKQRVGDYFLMEKSLQTLSNTLRYYYVLPKGFDEIYNGIKMTKRFKLYILICIFNWIATFYHLIWISSDYIWSKTDGPFLPEKIKVCFAGITILLNFISVFKTDLILGEIKYNLSPLKVIYLLTNNNKESHKLTDRNYKRLAIWIRIIITFMLNYVKPTFIILCILMLTLVSLLSCQLYWLMYEMIMTPVYINMLMVYLTASCVIYVYFPYYNFRFDQLNHQIKATISNGKRKIIHLKLEKKLLSLIDEHNKLSIEVNGMNLMIRRSAAVFFITLSLIKILTLYLMIYVKNFLIKFVAINAFFMFFSFGFGISLALSMQIKSAHRSLKLIDSIVSNYKMRLPLRFKVN